MLEHSALMNEITAVTEGGGKDVHYHYSAQFILPGGTLVSPLKVISKDVIRDYTVNYGDESILKVVFGIGTYTNLIYPARNNLSISLQREVIGEIDDRTDLDSPVDTQTYRAYVLNMKDHSKEGTSAATDNVEQGDASGIITVEFQLVDSSTEWLRSVSVGGVFRQATPADVLKSILANESQSMPIARQDIISVIDFVEADNLTKRAHIVIPHPTALTDLAAHLQNNCGGIYNSGIGFYLQQNSWYVWPLYNIKRFESVLNGLTIINIPEGRFPNIERTYRQTNNHLVILATGETKSIDTASNMQQAQGHGIRFADAGKLFDSFGESIGNITKIARGQLNTEVLVQKSLTGLSHLAQGIKRVSGNLFSELSGLAPRQGQIVVVAWDNSNPDLIYPGMPVKYLFEKDGVVYEREGVVLIAQHYTQMSGSGASSRRYISSTALTLFVGMDDE